MAVYVHRIQKISIQQFAKDNDFAIHLMERSGRKAIQGRWQASFGTVGKVPLSEGDHVFVGYGESPQDALINLCLEMSGESLHYTSYEEITDRKKTYRQAVHNAFPLYEFFYDEKWGLNNEPNA